MKKKTVIIHHRDSIYTTILQRKKYDAVMLRPQIMLLYP